MTAQIRFIPKISIGRCTVLVFIATIQRTAADPTTNNKVQALVRKEVELQKHAGLDQDSSAAPRTLSANIVAISSAAKFAVPDSSVSTAEVASFIETRRDPEKQLRQELSEREGEIAALRRQIDGERKDAKETVARMEQALRLSRLTHGGRLYAAEEEDVGNTATLLRKAQHLEFETINTGNDSIWTTRLCTKKENYPTVQDASDEFKRACVQDYNYSTTLCNSLRDAALPTNNAAAWNPNQAQCDEITSLLEADSARMIELNLTHAYLIERSNEKSAELTHFEEALTDKSER